MAADRAEGAPIAEDAVVALLLAVSSMEVFINELSEWVVQDEDNPSMSKKTRDFGKALQAVETNRGSLELKYLIASLTLSGRMYDRGANPYQDFALLVKPRNDILHLKPRPVPEPKPGKVSGAGLPRYIVGLQQRGLARVFDEPVFASWFDLIKTHAMAAWACQASLDMILSVLAMIPYDPITGGDPTLGFKAMFREFSSGAVS